MTPEGIKRFREQHGLSQAQLAELINAPLDRKYGSAVVSAWETRKRNIPDHVSVYLDALAMESNLAPPTGEYGEAPPAEDDFPPGPQTPPLHIPSIQGSYTRICTELWEMVATGVGMTGALLNNEAVKQDGLILDASKHELGEAYGKLAETNETFRRMLTGMTTQTTWLEVCFVTGKVAGRIYHNHAGPPPAAHDLRVVQPEPEPQPGIVLG